MASSRVCAGSELSDLEVWTQRWRETRSHIAKSENQAFKTLEGGRPLVRVGELG